MKKILLLLAISLLIIPLSYGQDVKLMTYNIRLDNSGDGENAWPYRKETVVNQLLFYAPDVIGTQEGKSHQISFLDKSLKDYSYVGVGRADVKEKGVGEYSAIFYNHKKYKELESGTFWLSTTPEKPSRGWDASLNRICTYILLKDKKSRKKFWVFNTHFDHRGKEALKESSRLIASKVSSMNVKEYPLFIMGDFNLVPKDEPIKFLYKQFKDAYSASQIPPYGPVGTFNGFKVGKPAEKRIDYIFIDGKKIKVKRYAAIADIDDLKYPSDHFPVFIEVELK